MGRDAPCPFCGHLTPQHRVQILSEGINGHFMACTGCGARGPLHIPEEGQNGEEHARLGWNHGNARFPAWCIVQRVRTDVERWGLRLVANGKGKPVEKWEATPSSWTRMGLDEAASLLVILSQRGFHCTLEVAP